MAAIDPAVRLGMAVAESHALELVSDSMGRGSEKVAGPLMLLAIVIDGVLSSTRTAPARRDTADRIPRGNDDVRALDGEGGSRDEASASSPGYQVTGNAVPAADAIFSGRKTRRSTRPRAGAGLTGRKGRRARLRAAAAARDSGVAGPRARHVTCRTSRAQRGFVTGLVALLAFSAREPYHTRNDPLSSPEQTPLVTAIVVNWNGGTMLEEALSSLLAQTWSNLEIILVDNGSRDGSHTRARERFGDRLRYLDNPKNEGFAHANNQGFAAARGSWMFLLNNDAVADPGVIEELMRFAADKPEIGMLACRVVRANAPQFFDSAGLLLYPDGIARPRGWEEKDVGQYDRAEEVLAPHGCACALRKSMLDEIGGFDEDFFCYLEDLDLGLRGQLQGWKCFYVPATRVLHKKSATAGNYSKFKAYHVERNRIYVALKCVPRFIVFASPLFTLNRYLMQAYAAYTHQGLSGEFVKEYSYPQLFVLLVRARLAALWRLPRMLRKRREISRRRKISVREWYGLISRFKLDAIELALKY